jgi:hypothetical protein
MNGRYFWFRMAALVVLLVVLGAVGVAVYNAGIQAGVSQAVQVTTGDGTPVVVAPAPVYHGWGWGWGFGFFGFFFWIIGFFLIIGLLRAIFGFGRWGRGGPGGWGYGRGGYYGGGGWGYGGKGNGGRGDQIADYHRELHRREESGETDAGSGRPPMPPTPPAASGG